MSILSSETRTTVKIAVISDTHGYLPPAKELAAKADGLLHAGDIGIDRNPIPWFENVFYPWAAAFGKPIWATFGNHDRIAERFQLPQGHPANLVFVVDDQVEVVGVPVWFSPWSMRFGPWAYMASDRELGLKYSRIPENTQVLVTHGPPFLAGDRTSRGDRVGSVSLSDRLAQLPECNLVITGHIHEDRGAHEIKIAGRQVRVLNATYVDEWYEPIYEPMILDWPPTP